MNENATAGAPRTIDRRTVVKGAAWSVPAIAAAVAMPLASASGGTSTPASLAISADCLLQVAGISAASGFIVTNSGTEAYSGTVTITETFHLNGILRVPVLADIIIAAYRLGTVVDYKSAGVSISGWTASDYLITFPVNLSPATITRTVTITGGIAGGAKPYWGRLLSVLKSLSLPGIVGLDWLASVEHTATITSPTGAVVTKATDQMNYHLLDGSC